MSYLTCMDPLNASTVLATIVGLLCNFRQERGAQETRNHQQFVEWLEYHRHEELKNLILNTQGLRAELDLLLRAEHSVMLGKLDLITDALATLLRGLDEYRGLMSVIAPDTELSEQGVSILRQFVNSTLKEIFISKLINGQVHLSGGIKVDDPRFLEDDLSTLAQLGLLSLRYNSKGDPVYGITRNAVKLLARLDEKVTRDANT